MIISAGQRTDIVQYYTPWLLRRFEEGFVLVRNPLFPSKVTATSLTLRWWTAWSFAPRTMRLSFRACTR